MAGRGRASRSGGRSTERGGSRRGGSHSSATDGGNAKRDPCKEIEPFVSDFGPKDAADKTMSSRRSPTEESACSFTISGRATRIPIEESACSFTFSGRATRSPIQNERSASSHKESIGSPTVSMVSYESQTVTLANQDAKSVSKRQSVRYLSLIHI